MNKKKEAVVEKWKKFMAEQDQKSIQRFINNPDFGAFEALGRQLIDNTDEPQVYTFMLTGDEKTLYIFNSARNYVEVFQDPETIALYIEYDEISSNIPDSEEGQNHCEFDRLEDVTGSRTTFKDSDLDSFVKEESK